MPGDWGPGDAPAVVVEPGCVPAIARDVVVLPWNHRRACERLIEQNREQLAAVLVDPLPMRLGLIAPAPGFLELLRARTEECGALYISDEVLCRLRGAHRRPGAHSRAGGRFLE